MLSTIVATGQLTVTDDSVNDITTLSMGAIKNHGRIAGKTHCISHYTTE